MFYLFIYLFGQFLLVILIALGCIENGWMIMNSKDVEGSGCCLLLGTVGISLEGLRKTTTYKRLDSGLRFELRTSHI
jgi:hypothetical protein